MNAYSNDKERQRPYPLGLINDAFNNSHYNSCNFDKVRLPFRLLIYF